MPSNLNAFSNNNESELYNNNHISTQIQQQSQQCVHVNNINNINNINNTYQHSNIPHIPNIPKHQTSFNNFYASM